MGDDLEVMIPKGMLEREKPLSCGIGSQEVRRAIWMVVDEVKDQMVIVRRVDLS